MNQIDISDYQYYVGCNTKRPVRLTFLDKKFLNIIFLNINNF